MQNEDYALFLRIYTQIHVVGLPLLLLSLLVRDSEFDYILIKRAIIKEQLFLDSLSTMAL
jgi:hypothetical protein